MKKLKQTLALILSITLLASIPIEAAGAVDNSESEQQTADNALFDSPLGEKESEVPIIKEIEEERTEFSKEFLLEDGTKMIAVYDQPVHYQDKSKEWVDYDNSLVAEGSQKVTNKANNINVNLSKETSESDMVQMSLDNYSISWGFENVLKAQMQVIKQNDETKGNEEFTNLTGVTSEACYSDVYKNTDLQYYVTSTGVKENIILKKADVQNEFTVNYKAEGLTAKQIDDYSISFVNKDNKEVYKLTAPYMTDADGKTSTQLSLKLESQDNGNIKVKLTANNEFIKSADTKFPITIDPEISKSFNGLFLLDEAAGSVKQNHGPYYVANEYSVLTQVRNLPSLSSGEQVVSAKFTYDITNSDSIFSSENDNPIIFNVHKINSINGNVVVKDNTVLDYDSITFNDNEQIEFDLTKLVKDWYAETVAKNGFLFEANDTIGNRQVNIKDRNSTDLNPSIKIIYKDFKGTESGMSYHTYEAGQKASISVSDYLGNLVVNQPIYDGTGERMPASISATYNSIDNTWGFSFNQKITAASSEMVALGYNYIYTDSQGANHYLKKADGENTWYDEDGLGVSLKVGESNLTVENGNTQIYALPQNGGMLLSEKDEHNNTITYAYSDNTATSITDGAGRVITIHSSDGKVTSFTLPGNKNVSISYSDNLITKVTFPSGRMSRFAYNDGKLVSVEQADNISGSETMNSKLGLAYTGDKVTRVTQYGSNGTEGNYLNFAYNTDNTTVFTDKQGREVTYTFDNSGNRISVLNANGYLESSASEGLFVTGGADSFTKNYITESTEHTASYYTQFNGSTSSGGSVTLDSENKYFGSNSVKIVNPAGDNNSAFFTGAAREFNASQFAGKTVTFSAYVKTSDVQKISGDGAIGACLSIVCTQSGDETTYSSIGITGTEGWQRLSVSANITSEMSSFKVCCNLRNASGFAWFDGMQLEEGSAANDLNILQNADFSSNANWFKEDNNAVSVQNGTVTISGVAGAYDNAQSDEEGEQETTAAQAEPSTYCVTEAVTSPMDSVITYDEHGNQIKSEQGFVTRTVKKTYEVEATEATEEEAGSGEGESTSGGNTTSNTLGNKYIYQNVSVGTAGMMFNLVGEAKADSVPLTNETRTFGIAMNIYYDGDDTPETHYQEFNSDTNKQQTVSLSITPDDTDKVIHHIAFAFVYGYNKNTMTVYNAMLNIAPVGYSSTVEDTTEPTTGAATEATTEAEEESDDYVDYEVLTETVDDSQTFMRTSTEYDSTGNNVVKEINEAGNKTEYEYDASGNVTAMIGGNDDYWIEYEYDNDGNMTSLSHDNSANQYTYNGIGNATTITHNGFNYNFNYDVFNQLTSTAIGSQTIASKTYSAEGLLTRNTYANGDYTQFNYDSFGNVSSITGENGEIARFVYNKKGLVAKAVDLSGGTVTYYQYDFNGSKVDEYRQTDAGALSYQLGYDQNGNKVEKTSVNGNVKTITNTTDDNGNSIVSNDGITVKRTSDDFGRVSSVKTAQNGTDKFETLYAYCAGKAANSTTNNVNILTQKFGNTELLKYYYGYDENGNISAVSETTNMNDWFEKYAYDDLNQLTHIVDKKNHTYTRFYYDDGGNIVQVDKSNYDEVSMQPSGLISRNTYTYGDTNWKDKLTKFNSTDITYDEMGNPLSYRDGLSFTWENGRQLKTVSNGDTTLTMRYDSNGLRTQKGGVRYYYDSDNNLIAMVKGGNTLLFYYDENGNVTSFSDGNSMYFYVKNLQGDIVNIVDSNGNVQVRYDYDVLGKITAIKNGNNQAITDTSSLAYLNPLRYRGYVFDDETGLYYLQSRYYDPVTGRFLNADVYADTGSGSPLSTNMFAYCENNTLQSYDNLGFFANRISTIVTPKIRLLEPIRPTDSREKIRNWISTFAGIYLDYKGYPIAKAMFNYFLYNKKFYSAFIEVLRNAIKKSKEFNNAVKYVRINIIKQNYSKRLFNTFYKGFAFENGDLHYAIGKASFQLISFTKSNSKLTLRVKVFDTYDFDEIRTIKDLLNSEFRGSDIANDLGYALQMTGIGKTYYWALYFNYIYYYYSYSC